LGAPVSDHTEENPTQKKERRHRLGRELFKLAGIRTSLKKYEKKGLVKSTLNRRRKSQQNNRGKGSRIVHDEIYKMRRDAAAVPSSKRLLS